MKEKNPEIYLKDIRESIQKLEEYIKNISKSDFLASSEKQDAVLRRLIVIGEAVRNLPDTFKAEFPNIPWRTIVGLRNFVIHEYIDIDWAIIWDTVKIGIPELKQHIQTLP